METHTKEMTQGVEKSIYIDIDALYDTRLSSLEIIHPELANQTLRSGYFKRAQDAFEMVPKAKFREVYESRNNEVLTLAVATYAFEMIRSITINLVAEASHSPFETVNKLYLNLYPYKIPKEAIKEIIEPLRLVTGGMLPIEVLYLKDEEICPRWAKHHLSVMIRYDWEQWLEVHNKSGRSEGLMSPELGLLVPRLWLGEIPSIEDQLEIKKVSGLDHFRLLEKEVRLIYDLVFMDIGHYCARIPPPVLAERLKISLDEAVALSFQPLEEIKKKKETQEQEAASQEDAPPDENP